MKKEQKQEWDANTPIITPYSHTQCRGGVIIGKTQSVSIPFLCLFFFHQSSLYPIKIFVKCLVCILFSAPYARAHKYEGAK